LQRLDDTLSNFSQLPGLRVAQDQNTLDLPIFRGPICIRCNHRFNDAKFYSYAGCILTLRDCPTKRER